MKALRLALGAALAVGSLGVGAEIHWRVTHNYSFRHLRYQPKWGKLS